MLLRDGGRRRCHRMYRFWSGAYVCGLVQHRVRRLGIEDHHLCRLCGGLGLESGCLRRLHRGRGRLGRVDILARCRSGSGSGDGCRGRRRWLRHALRRRGCCLRLRNLRRLRHRRGLRLLRNLAVLCLAREAFAVLLRELVQTPCLRLRQTLSDYLPALYGVENEEHAVAAFLHLHPFQVAPEHIVKFQLAERSLLVQHDPLVGGDDAIGQMADCAVGCGNIIDSLTGDHYPHRSLEGALGEDGILTFREEAILEMGRFGLKNRRRKPGGSLGGRAYFKGRGPVSIS